MWRSLFSAEAIVYLDDLSDKSNALVMVSTPLCQSDIYICLLRRNVEIWNDERNVFPAEVNLFYLALQQVQLNTNNRLKLPISLYMLWNACV